MADNAEKLRSVWSQGEIPVLLRRGKGFQLFVRLPFHPENRHWLRNGRQRTPTWDSRKQRWALPQSWFNDTLTRLLQRYGSCYVIQPYREQEKCAPACWNAEGQECQCSCMGAHQGSGSSWGRWFIVSDTFATRWKSEHLACRLINLKSS